MLIKTKLLQPPAHKKFVVRRRFVNKFKTAIEYRLISVSAPAGYGKTTALSQVARDLSNSYAVGWLSLDARDNQESSFLRYFIGCLQIIDGRLGKDVQQSIDSSNIPILSDCIASILNDIGGFEGHIFLVIDDFHFIQSQEIKNFLEVLVNLAPENFHLIVSSRIQLQFPIITKNARSDTLEVSTQELRFDLDEVRQFIDAQEQYNASESDLVDLLDHSEGWAVGLQLLVLYLSKAPNSSLEALNCAGNLRDVADYLVNQVLVDQSDQAVDFLIRTSILQRFNAQVCDHILGRDDSSEFLNDFFALNLFLVPLDQSGEWFRYHHFFQEFLQAQLSLKLPKQKKALYKKAAAWFEQNDMQHEAVEYALDGHIYDLATALIEKLAIAEFTRGRMPRVNEWIEQIPEAIRNKQARLLLIQGTSLYHMNRADEAFPIISILRELEQNSIAIENIQNISDEITALEVGILMCSDRFDQIPRMISPDFQVSNEFTKGAVHNICGYAYYRSANYELAMSEFDKAAKQHTRAGSLFGLVYSACFKVLLHITRGKLDFASKELESLNRIHYKSGDQPRNVASVVDIMNGVLSFECLDWSGAQKMLEFGLPRIEKVGHLHILLTGYSSLVRIRLQRKDFAVAFKLVDSMLSIAGPHATNTNRLLIDALKIELLLAQDRLADALNLATLLDVPLGDDFIEFPENWNEVFYLKSQLAIRILIGASQNETALAVIPRLSEYLKSYKQGKRHAEILWLKVVSQFASSHTVEASETMFELIKMLASHSMFSPIVCGSGPVQEILEHFLRTPDLLDDVVSNDFIQKCLEYLRDDLSGTHLKPHEISLTEPLSTRELEILTQMSLGKSNAKIAKELFISEGTVKWHCGNIYGKLSVKNRTAAVITAKELKLVS